MVAWIEKQSLIAFMRDYVVDDVGGNRTPMQIALDAQRMSLAIDFRVSQPPIVIASLSSRAAAFVALLALSLVALVALACVRSWPCAPSSRANIVNPCCHSANTPFLSFILAHHKSTSAVACSVYAKHSVCVKFSAIGTMWPQ